MRDYKTLFETNTHSVINKNDDLKIISNYTRVGVVPYIIDDSGLFTQIGVISYDNYYDNTSHLTIASGYRVNSDASCMITANRLLFELTKINITNAENWMYMGDIYTLDSGTPLKLYCVNVSEHNEDMRKYNTIEFIDINKAITSDDAILLTSYLRLFNLYYTQNMGK